MGQPLRRLFPEKQAFDGRSVSAHKASNVLKAVLIAALVVSVAGLSGCRYSDTLLEVIIDPNTGTYEPDAKVEYREVEGAPENPDLASVHLAENENYADQASFLPVYKEDASINGQAVQRKYEVSVDDSVNASTGNEQDTSEDENTSTSQETQETEDPNSSGDGENTDETQTSDDGYDTQADKTAGRGGEGQTFGDGAYDDLPDVRAVAAKGHYATITQMLAGKGGLAATDAAWKANVQQYGAFPGEGIDEVAIVWDENGTLNVDALVDSHADAVLVDNVDVALSESDEANIKDAGINVVQVPTLGQTYTSDDDIMLGVEVVGQLLSGLNSESAYSTADMVEKYRNLHDTALNGCLNANGGYSYKLVNGVAYQGIYRGNSTTGETTSRLCDTRCTTACIDAWVGCSGSSITAEREFGFHELYLNKQSVNLTDGVGLSACTVGGNFILTDYYLQAAGVVNNAYDGVKPTTNNSNNQESLRYAVVAGSSKNLTAQQVGSRSIPSPLWYSQYGINPTDHWSTVGDDDFPGIIVRNSQMAQSVQSSAAKTNGLYNVGQTYQIYQMPAGLSGSWFDGNIESFLTSVWAYAVFQEDNISTAEEWVDAFYQQFYRMDSGVSSRLEGFGAVYAAKCPKG